VDNSDNPFFDFQNGKILINLTNICNVRCRMCSVVRAETHHKLTRKQAFDAADFAIENNFELAEVSGGEIFILDYAVELIEKLCGGPATASSGGAATASSGGAATASKNGATAASNSGPAAASICGATAASKNGVLKVLIVTNGTLLNDDHVEKFRHFHNLTLMFSIHGVGLDHDSIVHKPGSFEKADRIIRKMAAAGINVAINSVIQKENYRGIRKLYEYFADVPYQWHSMVPTELEPSVVDVNEVIIPSDDIDWLMNEIELIREAAGRRGNRVVLPTRLYKRYENTDDCLSQGNITHPGYMCSVARRSIIVLPSAEVVPCYHYNWKKQGISLNIAEYESLSALVYGRQYMDMILKATGLFGCRGCNTLCYSWDKDFARKIMNPTFMDTALMSSMDFEKREIHRRIATGQQYLDGLSGIKKYAENRPVYIWGTGDGGGKTLKILNVMGITVSAFIDGDPGKCGAQKCGLNVLAPESLLKDTIESAPGRAYRPYVVIGSIYVEEISVKLKNLGYLENIDFQVSDSL
jgi:MoaA/NifB/PqqE/SkfB family radical SAM enzyme